MTKTKKKPTSRPSQSTAQTPSAVAPTPPKDETPPPPSKTPTPPRPDETGIGALGETVVDKPTSRLSQNKAQSPPAVAPTPPKAEPPPPPAKSPTPPRPDETGTGPLGKTVVDKPSSRPSQNKAQSPPAVALTPPKAEPPPPPAKSPTPPRPDETGTGPLGETVVDNISTTEVNLEYDENEDEEEEEDAEEDQVEKEEEEEEEEVIDECLPPPEEEEDEDDDLSVEPSSLLYNPKSRRHRFIKHEICIHDKARKPRPVPKGKPWYLKETPDPLEKRMDSKIAFNMPKQEDPEVIALRRTNKMVQKLIKYMKKSWKIRINHKQADRELEFRTLVSVYTSKPENWLDLIRAREDRALETGFFSAMDIPYEALIDLELDTALLTFKNLPPELKITAARWIRMKLRKEELKRKREAHLPRLIHGRVQRPSYNKGRLIKDPGGVKKVDQFVKVGEWFRKLTRGNKPYSKVLKEWNEKNEQDNHTMNSGFGGIHEGMFDFSKTRDPKRSFASASATTTGNKKEDDGGFSAAVNADTRRVSIVDARQYQRDMLYYEKVLIAIYNIVKSLLNIKMKQLESRFPLPHSVVLQIRDKSPGSERNLMRKKSAPPLIQKRREKTKSRSVNENVNFDADADATTKRGSAEAPGDVALDADNNPGKSAKGLAGPEGKDGSNIRKSLLEFKEEPLLKENQDGADVKAKLAQKGPQNLTPEDLFKLRPVRDSKPLIQEIKKSHSREDLKDMKMRRQRMLTAEDKIKRLGENPDHAAIRRARNYLTYTKLFERNRMKMKKPVWHNIDIAAMNMDFNSPKGVASMDPANLTQADASQLVDLALQKRKTLSHFSGFSSHHEEKEEEQDRRWPEEYDIPTPTYPFPNSGSKMPSEDQSKLNLLKKAPHMDEAPSTPERRLYKLAGVHTTQHDLFSNILDMKKTFRVTENKTRVYYENEIGKLEWDTTKRFRTKLAGIHSTPVYQWTISKMREAPEQQSDNKQRKDSYDEDDRDAEMKRVQEDLRQKRPALWYRKLQEEGEINGALRHSGCGIELQKLMRYCDVDLKTKPHMLNRLALLVVSLPTTELGTKHWQQAVVFLLEFMFGTPPGLILHWLNYRGLPFLLN